MEAEVALIYSWESRQRIHRLVGYVTDPDKTEGGALVSAIGCSPERAAEEMLAVKEWFQKENGVQARHIVLDFLPGEITPALAHELGNRFAREHLDDFQTVIATHVDGDRVHNHLVVNSVSDRDGHKYQESWEMFRKKTRAACEALFREYGLRIYPDIAPEYRKAVPEHRKDLAWPRAYMERKLHNEGFLTCREVLDLDAEQALSMSLSLRNFYDLMEDRGYTVRIEGGKPGFTPYGFDKTYRLKKDGKVLSEADIQDRIDAELADPEVHVIRGKRFVPEPDIGEPDSLETLYASWMYVLEFVGTGGRIPNVRTDYAELRYLRRYRRQAAFVRENRIETLDQLDVRRGELEARIRELSETRADLKKKSWRRRKQYRAAEELERLEGAAELYRQGQTWMEEEYRAYQQAEKFLKPEDPEAVRRERTETEAERARVRAELRQCRSELLQCRNIARDAPGILERLKEIERETARERYGFPAWEPEREPGR